MHGTSELPMSFVALMVCTCGRWDRVTSRLIAAVEDSALLDESELDELAESFRRSSASAWVRAQLALEDRFSPSRFWAQVRRNAATCTLLFPAQVNLPLMLADERESSSAPTLRLVIRRSSSAWCSESPIRFEPKSWRPQ